MPEVHRRFTEMELAAAMQAAQMAHHQYEKKTGTTDENWPRWYAHFMMTYTVPVITPPEKDDPDWYTRFTMADAAAQMEKMNP